MICLYLPSWYQTVKVKIYMKPKFSKQIKWDCIKYVLKKEQYIAILRSWMKCRMQIIALYSRMNLGWIFFNIYVWLSKYFYLIIAGGGKYYPNLNFSRLSSLKRYCRSLNFINNSCWMIKSNLMLLNCTWWARLVPLNITFFK